MRSSTGGIGSAGGEGVVHSPTSMKRSATMPSKGARSTVLSSSASRGPSPSPRARPPPAPPGRRPRRARASLSTRSTRSSETMPCCASCACARARARRARPRGRPARAARRGRLLVLARGAAAPAGASRRGAAARRPAARAPRAARQRQHPAADLGRELGAAAGLDRAGPRVGDRLLDAALSRPRRPARGSPRERRACAGRPPPPRCRPRLASGSGRGESS